MQVIHDFSQTIPKNSVAVLTIGNFDGLHLGHQALLKRCCELRGKEGHLAVFSFSNHPSSVLTPQKKVRHLTTIEQKLDLLASFGVDSTFLFPFTEEFSKKSFESFLREIRKTYPFSHLILGHDARFGKGREGDPQHLSLLAKEWNFHLEYLEPYTCDGSPISSTRIRQGIVQGELAEVKKWLGRRFSIQGTVVQGKALGRTFGFPTANLKLDQLCLPPFGIYAVTVKIGKSPQEKAGVASLGIAPTVRQDQEPLLEVHLFDQKKDLYGESLEVIFHAFLRSEEKFSGKKELIAQMEHDKEKAKLALSPSQLA